MDELISVIVPVYNSEKHITKCIKSIQGQTYKNLEIIIVDDGSTDNSLEYCEELAAGDDRIHVIHTENGGVSHARNIGLDAANGEYITFVDSDDWIRANRIDTLVETIFQYHADIVYTEFSYLPDIAEKAPNDVIVRCGGGGFVDDILFNPRISRITSVWRGLFKRSVAKSCRFRNMKFAEDLFYMLDCSVKANTVVITNDTSYIYNNSNEKAMTKNLYNKKYTNNFIDIVIYLRAFMKEYGFVGEKYIDKLSTEYIVAARRIVRTVSLSEAINLLDDSKFREGISDMRVVNGSMKQKILFFLFKHRLYGALLLLRFK